MDGENIGEAKISCGQLGPRFFEFDLSFAYRSFDLGRLRLYPRKQQSSGIWGRQHIRPSIGHYGYHNGK
jgi:hypothetical protein